MQEDGIKFELHLPVQNVLASQDQRHSTTFGNVE